MENKRDRIVSTISLSLIALLAIIPMRKLAIIEAEKVSKHSIEGIFKIFKAMKILDGLNLGLVIAMWLVLALFGYVMYLLWKAPKKDIG